MNKKKRLPIIVSLLVIVVCILFLLPKESSDTIMQVKIKDTGGNIEGLEMTAKILNDSQGIPHSLEILFENNSSQTLTFKEMKVYSMDINQKKELKSLQQSELLDLWSIFSPEQAATFNAEEGEDTCDNTYQFTTLLWEHYTMKNAGLYQVELIFMDDERSEVGSVWITIEQTK